MVNTDELPYMIGESFMNRAKQGFYPNDPRKGLSGRDFAEAIGMSLRDYEHFQTFGWILVQPLVYKKMKILASPQAPYFRALFKILDLREQSVEVA